MGKNLKDLINRAEVEEKTHAQHVSTIESLQMKVTKLETKLKEQKETSESERINILNKLISSQKKKLVQMQQENEVLQQNIDTSKQVKKKKIKDSDNDSAKDHIILKTQNSLNKLIEDYGRLETMNKSLKEESSEIKNENRLLLEKTMKIQTEISNVKQIERDLKKQLNDLERENILSVNSLEKTIQNLESINSESKKENQKLTTKLDAAKADRLRLTKFEAKASNLEKEVQALHKENEELRQKAAILLAKTINIMETQKKEPTIIAENLVSEEPLLEERGVVKMEEKFEVGDTIEKPVKIIENEMLKEETVTRKKVCPNCGNTKKDFIREIDDKTKIIYTHPKIYAKMYKCGECGTEWC